MYPTRLHSVENNEISGFFGDPQTKAMREDAPCIVARTSNSLAIRSEILHEFVLGLLEKQISGGNTSCLFHQSLSHLASFIFSFRYKACCTLLQWQMQTVEQQEKHNNRRERDYQKRFTHCQSRFHNQLGHIHYYLCLETYDLNWTETMHRTV